MEITPSFLREAKESWGTRMRSRRSGTKVQRSILDRKLNKSIETDRKTETRVHSDSQHMQSE